MNDRATTEESRRHRGLFDQLPSAVAIYRVVDDGRDFIILDLNPAAEQLDRVDRQDVVGRSVFEVFPGVEEFGLVEVFRRVWNTKTAVHHPVHRYQDGRITGWRQNYVCLLPTGEIASIYHDAIEARQAEEALRESEARYRRLVENLRREYFFYSHDSEGVFTYLSPSVAIILGYPADEYLTHYDEYFTDNPINAEARHRTERSITGEQQEPYEVEVRHKDGSKRRLEVIEVPVVGAGGEVIAVEGIAHDVTAKRTMEQEMLKVQKLEALGVLAGGIAHDFNNLLTVILSNLSLTEDTPNLEPEVREQLDDARQATDQARHLTQQLLTFSRGGKPVRQPLALDDLVPQVVGLATRGSKVITELSVSPLPAVNADPGQIHQVLSNICINAVQAMPDGGKLEVSGAKVVIDSSSPLPLDPGTYVRLRLQDQGPGIAPDAIGRIFDPYFTTKPTGTGLGLTVCFSVIRNHGGHIAVSMAPAGGAIFDVYLPALPSESPPAHHRAAAAPAGGGRVLVMDDDPGILRIASKAMERLGYQVATASDGERAIELYASARDEGSPFGIVVLDLTVPGGLGGKETLDRLRAIDPKVRAIVSSGYSSDPVMAHYRAHGFAGVLPKPYEPSQLRAVLAAVEDNDDGREGGRRER